MKNTTDIFTNKSINKSIKKVDKVYRPYDPGWYLYKKVLETENIKDKFTDEFLELIYVTLSAWNMNSRGARLADIDVFKRSLKKHKKPIIALSKYRIEKISNIDDILVKIEQLFKNLEIVYQDDEIDKPRLVTFSKTLHFLIPDLFVPIDRKYTLMFFYGNVSINKNIDKQWEKFEEIFREFHKFSLKVSKMNIKFSTRWVTNIPKIIDNVIIGYQKMLEKP